MSVTRTPPLPTRTRTAKIHAAYICLHLPPCAIIFIIWSGPFCSTCDAYGLHGENSAKASMPNEYVSIANDNDDDDDESELADDEGEDEESWLAGDREVAAAVVTQAPCWASLLVSIPR